jgi:hypothetical protein
MLAGREDDGGRAKELFLMGAQSPARAFKAIAEEPAAAIERLTNQIQNLSASHDAAIARKRELLDERSTHVCAARADKDPAALDRLRAIDDEVAPLRQGISDDESAIEELTQELKDARTAKLRQDWEAQRRSVRAMLVDFGSNKRAAALQKAADELKRLLLEAQENEAKVARAMSLLDPSLRPNFDQIGKMERDRRDRFGYALQSVLPIHTGGLISHPSFRDAMKKGEEEVAGQIYARAIKSVDESTFV